MPCVGGVGEGDDKKIGGGFECDGGTCMIVAEGRGGMKGGGERRGLREKRSREKERELERERRRR